MIFGPYEMTFCGTLFNFNLSRINQEIALTSEDTEVYASSAETVGDPSFARFERPVRLLSGCVVSS